MSGPAAEERGPGPRLAWLEAAAVVLLLVAAFVPRVQGLYGPFDRECEGFQGALFTGWALNYERLGILRYAGYPVSNLLLPTDPDATPYLYPNHPPFGPLLTWVGLELFGPRGWKEALHENRAAPGLEGPGRMPFFLFHLAGLVALWWAVRQGGNRRLALLSLAVAACVPVSILYAYFVNYENVYLPFLLVACGFHVRWLLRGRGRDLALAAGALFLSAAVTFAPVFFVPFLLLQAFWRRAWRRAAAETAALVPAALLPPLIHGAWVHWKLPAYSTPVADRADTLLRPLFDGSQPFAEWCRRQWIRSDYYFSQPLLWLAIAGLALLVWRLWREGRRARDAEAPRTRISLALPLLLGGLSVQLGFYTHTFDGAGLYDGQTFFLLNLVPAVALLAAHSFDALAPALDRLRGGLAPLVVAVLLVATPALLRAGDIAHRWRDPGPRDDPRLASGPEGGLPSTYGREIAEVLPPDAIGLVPKAMGFPLPAVMFYAWRQLVPVDRAIWGTAMTRIQDALHLGDRERFLLVPRDPPPAARAQVADERAELVKHFGKPLQVTEHWERWPTL